MNGMDKFEEGSQECTVPHDKPRGTVILPTQETPTAEEKVSSAAGPIFLALVSDAEAQLTQRGNQRRAWLPPGLCPVC
jgi:hypothetical protein